MWVIFCRETGNEVDRIEDYDEAVQRASDASDFSTFSYNYDLRFER